MTNMYDYSLNGVFLSLIRDVRAKADKYAECPLKFRVTYMRKQKYYPIGLSMSVREWDVLGKLNDSNFRKGEFDLEQKKIVPLVKQHKSSIDYYYENRIYAHVKELALSGDFSFERLELKLSKRITDSLIESLENKVSTLRGEGNVGNASIYKATLNNLNVFTSGKVIRYSDVTVSWLEKYERWMSKGGISFATMSMRLRNIRTMMLDAKKAEIIKESAYPFGKRNDGKYQIPTTAGREIALMLDDIHRIQSYECATDTMRMCRDLALFSFYASGMNIGDILRLKYKDVLDGEIVFLRKKTATTTIKKKKISTPVLPPMQGTIDRWGNPYDKNRFIFPSCNGCTTEEHLKAAINNATRLINKNLKRITAALGLPDVSTYSFRHSFATLLAQMRVPESYIAEQLGHSAQNVTQLYINPYLKADRLRYNSLLLPKD